MKKILVAEDDIFLNKVYGAKLRLRNFETVSVFEGDKVVKMTKESKPDLIVLDVIMPGEDGFSVLKKLKEDGETKNIPVMVLTNLSESSDRETLLALGATDVMTKVDVSLSQVIEVIEKELA